MKNHAFLALLLLSVVSINGYEQYNDDRASYQGMGDDFGFQDFPEGATIDQEFFLTHLRKMYENDFKHYDKDQDGYISPNELKQTFGEQVPDSDIVSFFEQVDLDRDGKCNLEEFVQYSIAYFISHTRRDPKDQHDEQDNLYILEDHDL